MQEELRASARKFQGTLKALGFNNEVVELKETTRSARDAARAVGCRVEQIAKSIVFRGGRTNHSILVVASGPNRVNEKQISDIISEPLLKADADFVKERTGYAIGGVPPLGHAEAPVTFIDEDLLQYEEIWAAAGTPNAVFKLAPGDLQKMTDGRVISVK
ncbi:MAG: YbaK/EbsC family protein [Desulfatiglandaceae bacterium]|jgi:prolyl-tRNA editing enzyme YbaK/EbsC (Cys-tRNA(Pro) deacylase)